MQIHWHVGQDDIDRIKPFVQSQLADPFVRHRIRTNVERDDLDISRLRFWFGMVACLLTTQQRSGPASAVTRFINTQPFPLDYATCHEQHDLHEYVEQTLRGLGGLRRWGRIAQELTENFKRLEEGLWEATMQLLRGLRDTSDTRAERAAVGFIDDRFAGFGPKQSRNLLQALGLTRYEIPIDSRITKWLNEFGFPIKLSAPALANRDYYHLVSDGVQELCRRCEVYPCVLDAAIFASFDRESWPEDGII